MSNYKSFLCKCGKCGSNTSKKYAAQHAGQCKACANPSAKYTGPKCPDCGGPISKSDLAKGYHCRQCTQDADPMGYANEVRGLYDYPD